MYEFESEPSGHISLIAIQLFLAFAVASPAAAAALVVHMHDASPPRTAAAFKLFKRLHGDTLVDGQKLPVPCQSNASV